MKDHQRTPLRFGRPLGPIVTTPTPSLTDQNEYEVGQQVSVTLAGRIVAVRPAGNGHATLKIDTGRSPEHGQFVYVMTDLADDVSIEVTS